MPLLEPVVYTTDYIESLPEGDRAELIDGVVFDTSAPSRIHQEIVSGLNYLIRDHIERHGGSCRVYPAPFAVYPLSDDRNYVEPDVSVICDKDKLNDRGCSGAPDLVIEVVSPTSRWMDYFRKTALYSRAGVREYWIVDPDKERTTVYRFEEDDTPTLYPFDALLPVSIYDDLVIDIASLLEE
jgi:Uma2 family endonuclease